MGRALVGMTPWRLACLGALVGCTSDVDQAWQLDHERVIALRATPPRLAMGEIAELDALRGYVGQAPQEADPELVEVVTPTSLASALSRQGTSWRVTAPSAAQLDAARAELELAATAPVPLDLRFTFRGSGEGADLVARKLVWLGEHADNPTLETVTIDGADAPAAAPLVVGVAVDIPVAVDFDDRYNINWLTSCGTMHDFDLARAYLRVEPEDAQEGTFALVVRDDRGGVAWRLWPISAR